MRALLHLGPVAVDTCAVSCRDRVVRRNWANVLVLALIAVAAAPTGAAAQPAPLIGSGQRGGIADQYIVVMKDQARDDAKERTKDKARARGATVRRDYRAALQGYAAALSPAALEEVRRDPDVAYVEVDRVVSATATQSNAPWGLDRIDQSGPQLSGSYSYTSTGSGVKAYIIDTGIRFSHTEFGARAVSGYDAIDGGSAGDCNGHGTHVAGIVGASTYGVAKQVGLIAVRVLDCEGSGTISGVIAGIDWVTADHGAGQPAVANLSLGGGPSSALDSAVQNSIADGVSYTVAAGNENADACLSSPGRAASALTVASTSTGDLRSSFSNWGTCVDLFAPGSNITSSWHTSDVATATISGTSMAAPHVAGAAALFLQTNPAASPATVADVINGGATTGTVTDTAGSPNRLLLTTTTEAADTSAPDTTIASGPSGPTASASPSFTFLSSEAPSTFECKLDTPATSGGYGSCASPKSYTNLADGSYTFSVRARDQASNTDATPASRTFTLDTAAPETTILSGPSGTTASASSSFAFSSSEAASTFECKLDAGAWAACLSPRLLTGLADGAHTLAARAIDAAGNTDPTPTTRTWIVDTTAPAPPTLSDTEPDSPANDNSPKIKGAAAAGATVRLYADMSCTGAVAATGSAANLASPGLSVAVADDSSTTFRATATDPAGNTSACSQNSATYVEDSTPVLEPTPILAPTPHSTLSPTPTAAPTPTPTPPPASTTPSSPAIPKDVTAPAAKLSGSRSQKLVPTVWVRVLCPDETCRITARATVRVPQVGAARAKAYMLRTVTQTIVRGSTANIRLKLPSAARRAIARALKARQPVSARMKITIADTSGNNKTLTRQIKLRR